MARHADDKVAGSTIEGVARNDRIVQCHHGCGIIDPASRGSRGIAADRYVGQRCCRVSVGQTCARGSRVATDCDVRQRRRTLAELDSSSIFSSIPTEGTTRQCRRATRKNASATTCGIVADGTVGHHDSGTAFRV